MNNVYIMSANRSAIGGFGGTLKNHCPVDLGTLVAKDRIIKMLFISVAFEKIGMNRSKMTYSSLKGKLEDVR